MKQVTLRLDEGLLAAVDERRGLVPRNAWVTSLLALTLSDLEDGERGGVRDGNGSPGRGLEWSASRAVSEGEARATESWPREGRQAPAKPVQPRPIIQKRK